MQYRAKGEQRRERRAGTRAARSAKATGAALPTRIRIRRSMRTGLVLGVIGVAVVAGFYAQRAHVTYHAAEAELRPIRRQADWTVGELRDNGLRVIPTGPDDEAAVLDPDQFSNPRVRKAYWIAKQIPAIMSQLYCWCGCENRGIHRSALACFEDKMGMNCDVCVGTAEIAWEMVQKGVTEADQIQAAVDAVWGAPG